MRLDLILEIVRELILGGDHSDDCVYKAFGTNSNSRDGLPESLRHKNNLTCGNSIL